MHASTSELRLRTLDCAPVATVIATPGETDAEIRYANSAFHALYAAEERTLNRELFVGNATSGPNASWRQAVKRRRAAVVLGPAQTDDGRPFWLEARVQPLEGGGAAVYLRTPPVGEPMTEGFAATIGAVEDAELAMAVLEASHDALALRDAEMTLLLDSFPGVAIFVDEDGDVRAMGGEALPDLGARRRPLAATSEPQSLATVFPQDAGKALTPLATAALAGRRSRFAFFCAGRAFDGLASPVTLEEGDIDTALLALTDVTDRLEAYTALAPTTRWRR